MSETEILAEILEGIRLLRLYGAIQCGVLVGIFVAVNLRGK